MDAGALPLSRVGGLSALAWHRAAFAGPVPVEAPGELPGVVGKAILFAQEDLTFPADGPWSLQHPIAYTLIWAVAIVLVCAPVAIRLYQRSITS